MPVLVCGSLAFDTIMVFKDRFANHILPDKVQILNVAFLVPEMRREFGGCAGNIAYNLKLLGGEPIPMATVGGDFGPYREHFSALNINLDHVTEIPELFTAQAFITTDLDDNQITAFHPGAMTRSNENHVRDVVNVDFGIVGPDSHDAMIQHANEFADLGVPFIFDPGQAMPLFKGEDFRAFIEQATYVTVNDYESHLLQERTGWAVKDIAERVKAYVVTRGPQGSLVHTQKETLEIPAAKPASVIDPTGCGDAYRAGLIYGLTHDLDLGTCGRIASLMGALKVAQPGTQNQSFDLDEFKTHFRKEFDYALD